MRPQDFAGGDAPLDGGAGWEIGGRIFPLNPRRLLTAHDRAMLEVWRQSSRLLASRRMGGTPPLPDRGGVLEQAAVMLHALEVMDAQAATLLPYFALPVVQVKPPEGPH